MDGIIENLYVSRELYSVLFGPICSKYKLTMTQMLVLLFLCTIILMRLQIQIIEYIQTWKLCCCLTDVLN